MKCRHCDEEARQVRRDHALWIAANISKEDRGSLRALVHLIDVLDKDIETAEAESAVPNE